MIVDCRLRSPNQQRIVNQESIIHNDTKIKDHKTIMRGRRHRLLDDPSVKEVNRAFGVRGVTRVVSDHADRGAAHVQFLEQVHDRFAVLRVEVPRRLVRQQDRGLSADGAGHGHTLLLTA